MCNEWMLDLLGYRTHYSNGPQNIEQGRCLLYLWQRSGTTGQFLFLETQASFCQASSLPRPCHLLAEVCWPPQLPTAGAASRGGKKEEVIDRQLPFRDVRQMPQASSARLPLGKT